MTPQFRKGDHVKVKSAPMINGWITHSRLSQGEFWYTINLIDETKLIHWDENLKRTTQEPEWNLEIN